MAKSLQLDECTRLRMNYLASVTAFEKMLYAQDGLVPHATLNMAMIRRLCVCFVALDKYLCAEVGGGRSLKEGNLQDEAEFFVKKGLLAKEDIESFGMLGTIYSVAQFPEVDNAPNIRIILDHVSPLFGFLASMAEKFYISQSSDQQQSVH